MGVSKPGRIGSHQDVRLPEGVSDHLLSVDVNFFSARNRGKFSSKLS